MSSSRSRSDGGAARLFLAVAPAALLAFIGVYIAFAQVRYQTPPVFEWPTVFPRARSLAWIAVLLAVAAVVVDLDPARDGCAPQPDRAPLAWPPFPPAGGPMTEPWLADACSLVEEFRAGRRSPVEELEATLAAIERSTLNAFSFVAADEARAAARACRRVAPVRRCSGRRQGADRAVAGWPETEACVVLRDRVATHDKTMVQRLRGRGRGARRAHDRERVRWHQPHVHEAERRDRATRGTRTRTPGGSSGGSAAAVAGGLVHARDRRRRRRVDPHPGRVHRPARV